MTISEREDGLIAIKWMTQQIYRGKRPELEEIDKRCKDIESLAGFLAKKRYEWRTAAP